MKSLEWRLCICVFVCVIFKHLHSTLIQILLVVFIWEKIWKWCIAQFQNGFERRTCKILCVRASSPNFFCLVKDLLCRIRQKGIMREYIFSRRRRRKKFWFLVFAVNVIFKAQTFYQLSLVVKVGKMFQLFLTVFRSCEQFFISVMISRVAFVHP